MSIFQWIVLAVIQGVTEFLPVSSSAHLYLPSNLLGWPDQGLAFDVAVHLGSLLAVVVYFRKIILDIVVHWTRALVKKDHDKYLARLGWFVIIGTIPAVVFGLFGKSFIDSTIRDNALLVIACTTLLFGLLLLWADKKATEKKGLDSISLSDVIFIGCSQALALIPGVSRSGITMTAALMIGINKIDSARFSFLLSIPVILAAGSLLGIDLVTSSELIDWAPLVWGSVFSFISALICISLFLKWIERAGFLPFVIYRILLSAVLFFVYFS